MEMSEKQVVDLFETGSLGSGGDAVRVSAVIASVTGVDEQRLARRCHDEGRLPTFDVDEIDVERTRGTERDEQTCARDRKTDKETSVNWHFVDLRAANSRTALIKLLCVAF